MNASDAAALFGKGRRRPPESPIPWSNLQISPPIDPAAPKKAFLLTVPFFHATGCHSILVPSLAAGNKIVLMYRWDPDRALQLLQWDRDQLGAVPAASVPNCRVAARPPAVGVVSAP